MYLPSDVVDNDVADVQRCIRVLCTVRLLILVTVEFINNNGVLNLVELNIFETNIRNATLSTTPGLNTDTVLTLGTGAASNSDLLDSFSRTTLTERTNTETMTIDTVNV